MKKKIEFRIGAKYKYHNLDEIFTLKNTNEFENVFYFECGHWCTDCVFIDLFDINRGLFNFQKQLKLNL